MATLLILTPLAIEHAALAAALSDGRHCENTHNGVKVISLEGMDLDLAVGGHGKVQFALSTQLLIQKFSPSLVICAGAAGALTAELKPLDVVIGEVTLEHDFRLRFVDRPLPRFPACPKALEKIRRRVNGENFKIHFGALASGDEDILEEKRAKEVRALTDALAVAWEGAGGARAARLHGVPFLEIRAITDSADANAADHFAENVKAGMRNVATVIQKLI